MAEARALAGTYRRAHRGSACILDIGFREEGVLLRKVAFTLTFSIPNLQGGLSLVRSFLFSLGNLCTGPRTDLV